MALVAEGRGVDQDFSALSVPQVESSGRKPYTPNQASIVAKLPQSRLVGHHYPTTDPARVATKGQGGSKVGRGQCSVCLRSGDLIDVSPQSVVSVKFTYVVMVVSFSGTKKNRIGTQPLSDGV